MDMVAEEKTQVLHQIISAMVQQDVDLGIYMHFSHVEIESFHQYLTTSFGHTKAGPMYR